MILDKDLGHPETKRETAGAPQSSRPSRRAGERIGAVGVEDRRGAHAVVRPGVRRSEANGDGGRVMVMSRPEETRTFARKAGRFSLMSAAIIAVSLLGAALFDALVPDARFSSTSDLPHLAAWMAGALVGLAAGIAALFKAGTNR